MIHIRYILDRPIKDPDESSEHWVYQEAVPAKGDAVVIWGSTFEVTGVTWMMGMAYNDDDTSKRLPDEEHRGKRDLNLDVVAVVLGWRKDLV